LNLLIWSGLLLLLTHHANAFEIVNFPSLDTKAELTGHFLRPEGIGPYPAVVFLHGCGGLGVSGGISPGYSSWAHALVKHGYAILMVDSAGSRGMGVTCGRGEKRRMMYRVRPLDAYGALAFLQSQNYIRADRIGLIGWSQGGGVVLLSIVQESIGRPDPAPEHDFKIALAFYPALCDDKLQSKPYTKLEPNSWSTNIPLLVLQGGADNWARPEPCIAFIDAVKKRGSPVSITVYPGAYHAFDAPSGRLKELPQYKTTTGVVPLVG
jgi:dienelactone hydrolase